MKTVICCFILAWAGFTNSAHAEGWISGGGSGIAIYSPNMPHTPENLVRVEAWTLYRARHHKAYKRPEEWSSTQDLSRFPGRAPSPSEEAVQQRKIEDASENILAEVYSQISQRSQQLAARLMEVDQNFRNDLNAFREEYEKSYLSMQLRAPYHQLTPTNDFGPRDVRLAENEEWVQVVKRNTPRFEVNAFLWMHTGADDRALFHLHEAGYAISPDKNSSRIQAFELFCLNFNFKNGDQKSFLTKTWKEWGLTVPVKNVRAPQPPTGVRQINLEDKPNVFADSLLELMVHSNNPKQRIPLEHSQLICYRVLGDGIDINNHSLKLVWLIGRTPNYEVKKLDDVEWSKFKSIYDPVRQYFNATTNRYEYPNAKLSEMNLCFDKRSFGRKGPLRFLEFLYNYDKDFAENEFRKFQLQQKLYLSKLRRERLGWEMKIAQQTEDLHDVAYKALEAKSLELAEAHMEAAQNVLLMPDLLREKPVILDLAFWFE